MKKEDVLIIRKMIKYCNDIDILMKRFHMDYKQYKTDISFQYACNMCIIQIGGAGQQVIRRNKGS